MTITANPTAKISRIFVTTAVTVLAIAAATSKADAKIACSEGYQSIRGNQLSTPYCQDEYVAQVARTYGIKTSGAAIRGQAGHKQEVCRLIGRDNRISQACIDYVPSGRGPRS
ncbi:MAG: hypothetical protein SH859_05395 [Hyphomicrobium aestuarii]|nr:hypothetical protein [Hyphomicrobium aestuarii]